jgi:PAS domain S-box-containing protein
MSGVSTVELDSVTRDLVQLRLAVEQLDPLAAAEPGVAALLQTTRAALDKLDKALAAQEEERRQLRALAGTSHVVNSTLDLAQVLDYVMDTIISLLEAERGFLMLSDEQGALEVRTARNLDREAITGSSFEISRSIAQQVARDGQPVVTTNAQADPRFSSQQSVVNYSLRSIVCVPLKVRDVVTGVIYADNRIRTGLFTDKDRDLLAAFANQAAVAIENARLFERVKQQLDAITEMKALMDNVFASIASGVITTDIGDHIRLFNRAAETILALPAADALGRHLDDVIPELAAANRQVAEVRALERPVLGLEVAANLARRGPLALSLNLSPLKDAQQQTLGVAIVVDDLTETKRLRAKQAMWRRYMSPAVIDSLPDDPRELRLGGAKREITTLFADIRGFTSFSETLDPEKLVEILNQYFTLAAGAVLAEQGTIDKFLGDAVMALFNAPLAQPDHALRAVRAALAIQHSVAAFHATIEPRWRLSFGIGLTSGEAVVGNIGTSDRLDFTAIGDDVNLAKRLQENAQPGQILASQSLYAAVAGRVAATALAPLQVKGRSAPEQVYELRGLL